MGFKKTFLYCSLFLFTDFQNFSSKIDNMEVDVLKPLGDDINKVLKATLQNL